MKPQVLWTRQKCFAQDWTFTGSTIHMHHLQPRRKNKTSRFKERLGYKEANTKTFTHKDKKKKLLAQNPDEQLRDTTAYPRRHEVEHPIRLTAQQAGQRRSSRRCGPTGWMSSRKALVACG